MQLIEGNKQSVVPGHGVFYNFEVFQIKHPMTNCSQTFLIRKQWSGSLFLDPLPHSPLAPRQSFAFDTDAGKH
jgi:hypothetical protein